MKKEQDPFGQLSEWLAKAEACSQEPLSMVLSTLNYSSSIYLSSRVVLFKEFKDQKIIFYTNYKSVKCRSLSLSFVRPFCALNFYWPQLKRQIRIEGPMQKTSREKSVAYWKTRPKESQLSQYISKQSTSLVSRQILETEYAQVSQEFQGSPVPCPPHWGGVAVSPYLIEFWEEKPHRLHHRLQFQSRRGWFQKNRIWKSRLLYP